MSKFVDKFVRDHTDNWPRSKVGCAWYLSKPYPSMTIVERITDAWRVWTGRSIAVHYAVDDDDLNPKKGDA